MIARCPRQLSARRTASSMNDHFIGNAAKAMTRINGQHSTQYTSTTMHHFKATLDLNSLTALPFLLS